MYISADWTIDARQLYVAVQAADNGLCHMSVVNLASRLVVNFYLSLITGGRALLKLKAFYFLYVGWNREIDFIASVLAIYISVLSKCSENVDG